MMDEIDELKADQLLGWLLAWARTKRHMNTTTYTSAFITHINDREAGSVFQARGVTKRFRLIFGEVFR